MKRKLTGLLLCGLLSGVGCGDDSDSNSQGDVDAGQDAGGQSDASTADSAVPAPVPIYMMALRIFSPDNTFLTYVKLTHELDLNFDTAALGNAREFAGLSTYRVHDGHILVGNAETATVTKFKIADDLQWQQVGEVNFGNHLPPDAYWNLVPPSGDSAYVFYGTDHTARVHYNLDTMTIVGTHEDTNLPIRAGWTLSNGGFNSDNALNAFPGPIVIPFMFRENESTATPPASEGYLAVYDQTTHTEKTVVQHGCGPLEVYSQDEDNNLYLSPMFASPVYNFYGLAGPTCTIKLKPDGTLDASFGEKNLADYSGGEDQGVNFYYLKNGKAIASFLDKSKLAEKAGVNFSEPFNGDVLCTSDWNCPTGKWELYDGSLWSQRIIDLNAGTSTALGGDIDPNTPKNYFVGYYTVEGRTFMQEANADGLFEWYEIDAETATAKKTGQATKSGVGEEAYIVTIERIQ